MSKDHSREGPGTEKTVPASPRVLVVDEDGMYYARTTVRKFFKPRVFEMTILVDPGESDKPGIAVYYHEDPPPGSYVYAASMALGEPFCNLRGPLVFEATDAEGEAVDISKTFHKTL